MADKSTTVSGDDENLVNIGCCRQEVIKPFTAELEYDKPYTLSVSGSAVVSSCLTLNGCGVEFVMDGHPDSSAKEGPVNLFNVVDEGRFATSWTFKIIRPKGTGGHAGTGGGGNCSDNNGDHGGGNGGDGGDGGDGDGDGDGEPPHISMDVSLGSMPDDSHAGMLHARFELTGDGATGVNLGAFELLTRFQDQFTIIKTGNDELSQVMLPQALIVLDQTAPLEVTASFYKPDDVEQNSNGGFDIKPDKQPYVQHIARNVDGDVSQVQILKVEGGQVVLLQHYIYDIVSDSVIEISNGSHTKVETTFDEATQTRTVTTTVCAYENGALNGVLSKNVRVYKTLAHGDEELIETINDPDNANLRTTYTYYVDAADEGTRYYGKLKHRIDTDGGWTFYEYDFMGRTYRTYRPWKNAPLTPDLATYQNCKVTETLYAQPIDGSRSTDIESRRTSIL